MFLAPSNSVFEPSSKLTKFSMIKAPTNKFFPRIKRIITFQQVKYFYQQNLIEIQTVT
jgi:hypothetical protein